jgi:gluconate kinase
MKARSHHFMPHKLLQSQFSDLEEPTEAIAVQVDQPLETIIEQILNALD